MFLEEHFPSEQYTEIEKVLKEKQNNGTKEQVNPQALSPKILIMIVSTGLIISLILYLLLKKSQKM